MSRKYLLATLLLLTVAVTVKAQRERNYIYLFDCTQSMEGYGGQPDIWSQTKQWLWDDIGQLKDGQITIIPFQMYLFISIYLINIIAEADSIKKRMSLDTRCTVTSVILILT